MSIIKRLSSTLVSSIDHLVADIENHDAVIQASLADMRKKIATARIRLAQIQRDENQLQEQINALQTQSGKWRTRAIDTAATDETRALACLQQHQQCIKQAEQLEQERLQYQHVAQTLAHDINTSEQQLNNMQHKQRLLRARQSSAEAVQVTQRNTTSQDTLNDTFERWEIRIAQDCTTLPPTPLVDPLEKEFQTIEQQNALKAELAALLAGKENSHGQ